jgi:lysophospholipase L1-like esterase
MKKILLTAILLFFISCHKKTNSQKTPKTRTEHEIIYDIRSDLFKSLPKKTNQNLFIGHSIIQYCNWDELLPNKKIINRGIGGAFIPDINKIVKSEIIYQPKAIFIMAGINDIGNNIPSEKIKSDYINLFATLKKYPNTKIYYLSILPSNKERLLTIKDLNSFAQKQCTDNIIYIDLFQPFANENQVFIKKYTIDDVHLSGEGYIKLAEILKYYL